MQRFIACIEVEVNAENEDEAHETAERCVATIDRSVLGTISAKVTAVEIPLDLGTEGELDRYLEKLDPRIRVNQE